jgi:hypothetical protein
VILSAIPDSMFQVDQDGKYKCLKISNIADDYFWYRGKSKLQNVKDDFPEEIAELILKNVKMTLATGNAQMFEFSYDSSDHLHFYEARVAMLDGDETLIMIRDITEKKNSEEEIIKAKEIAENSEFFTVSSLVTVALVEFISKWDERQKLNDKDFVKKIIIAVIKKIDTMNINPEQLEEMIKTGEIFKKIEE